MKLLNSITNKKEEFVPVKEGKVGIYACGPTVYNYFHIGNARPFVIFDTLRRYFEYRGYDVTYVQNFTDIDDKMIDAAINDDTTVRELADKYIAEYFKDADALNIKRADEHPKATEHIDDIILLVQKLVDSGHAYVAEGDVYFDTSSFPNYGKLSGQNLDDLEMGARVDVSGKKKNPMDFVLWKAKKEGEPAWKSPWGKGRPGWHIECSAMSMKYLGSTVDIHGGGQDLKFPHHENEIAQSEAATGEPFTNYWMHNGHINVDNRKMSKSQGNYFTMRDILKDFDGIVVRLFLLSAHYASPINFSKDLLTQTNRAYNRITNCRENLKFIIEHPKDKTVDIDEVVEELDKNFKQNMDDDLNTAGAIGDIFEYIKQVNTLFEHGGNKAEAERALDELDKRLDVLGLINPEQLKEDRREQDLPDKLNELLTQREKARTDKDWKTSDELRDAIMELGYSVKDTADGMKVTKI